MLTSHVISPAASARACRLVSSSGQVPSRCQRGKVRRPSATARSPLGDLATEHQSSRATEYRRSDSVGPETVYPTPQPATTSPVPTTARQKDHHDAGRGTEPAFKAWPSRCSERDSSSAVASAISAVGGPLAGHRQRDTSGGPLAASFRAMRPGRPGDRGAGSKTPGRVAARSCRPPAARARRPSPQVRQSCSIHLSGRCVTASQDLL